MPVKSCKRCYIHPARPSSLTRPVSLTSPLLANSVRHFRTNRSNSHRAARYSTLPSPVPPDQLDPERDCRIPVCRLPDQPVSPTTATARRACSICFAALSGQSMLSVIPAQTRCHSTGPVTRDGLPDCTACAVHSNSEASQWYGTVQMDSGLAQQSHSSIPTIHPCQQRWPVTLSSKFRQ